MNDLATLRASAAKSEESRECRMTRRSSRQRCDPIIQTDTRMNVFQETMKILDCALMSATHRLFMGIQVLPEAVLSSTFLTFAGPPALCVMSAVDDSSDE